MEESAAQDQPKSRHVQLRFAFVSGFREIAGGSREAPDLTSAHLGEITEVIEGIELRLQHRVDLVPHAKRLPG